ncbi:sensor histidine kinase [Cohnella sp. GCM10027633]|uniref:cache domain-containing sensor histidine kinase n=1 Tax=unclassified Cohnella TaxID=2636738 RepID=UPI00363D84BC
MINPVKRYRDLNLRYKLFLQYLLLLAVSFGLFVFINYRITARDLEEQARYSSRQAFEQSRAFMEYKLSVVKTYLNVLSANEQVQEVLSRTPEYYGNNYGLWNFDIEKIRKQFYFSKPSNDILKTSMYTDRAFTAVDETDDFMRMERIVGTIGYENLLRGSHTFEMFPSEVVVSHRDGTTKTIAIVRSIADANSLQDSIGLLRADVPENLFSSILDRVAFSATSSIFLIDDEGTVVSRSSQAAEAGFSFRNDVLKGNTKDDLKAGAWTKRQIGNEVYLVGAQNVADSDWVLVSLVPYRDILGSQRDNVKQMMYILLAIAVFSLPLAFLAASSATRRIRTLIRQMKNVKQGDFDVHVQHSSKDEIGELARNFKSMISRVSQLLEDKYELGQEVKSMELKALQAQINPHFLYNTLDLIYWKAMRIHEQSIYELVQALSKFYKLSLSRGEDIVTLQNELAHIQAYADIQNARFKNGIALSWEVSPDLLDHPIPKITLQPLVENAIIHGILETEEGKGSIVVRAYAEGNVLVITVKDDGVGIVREKLGGILDELGADPTRGYGARNVNRRIKLLFGERYGLSYRHNDGPGVTAVISLPL